MSFSDIVAPRKEVLTGTGVEGIIDLENLRDASAKQIEARPRDFLDLTWPTKDITFVIEKLHSRFTEAKRTEGLFLFEGYKGSGKSHLLLLIYHLAKNPTAANDWLKRHNLECALPDDIEVIVHKFTDFPLYALWNLVVPPTGGKARTSDRPPNLDELRAVLKGKHIFLILDELEMGIRTITDPAVRDQNLAFLQMLTEEGHRAVDAPVTVFASVYDAAREPGATLKRVPRIDVKFSDPSDRTKIVLHRLFQDRDSVDRKKIETVVTSYRNDWKRKGMAVTDQYCDQMLQTYPFSPELLRLVLEHARDLFQGTRGALGLLGALVRQCHRTQDLITSAHATLRERSIRNLLIDLDPGSTKIQCAQSDLQDLQDLPLSEEIVSSVLMATLAASGRSKGLTEKELGKEVLKPGDDVNVFKGTLQAFHKLGTYFHEQEGAFFFDPEEKPNAKVEYRSLNVKPSEALAEAFKFWKQELFHSGDSTVFQDPDQTKAELGMFDRSRPRYVLAPRRLTREERHQLYFGTPNRNLVILLEPKAKDFNALEDPDIIKWAQRQIAATELQASAGPVERKRQFERIAKEDKDYILRAFKNAGFAFVWFQKYGSSPADDQVEVEPLGNVTSREEVEAKLRQQFFPVQRFEEHINERLSDFIGKRVRDVERTYQEALGFPIPTHATTILDAITNLCKQKQIGIRHERDKACGRRPDVSPNELLDAIVSEPFEDNKLTELEGLGSRPTTQPTGGASTETPETETKAGDQIAPTTKATVYLETPFAHGVGDLRQEVAVVLSEHEDAEVQQVTFRIFFEKKSCDFGTLPSGLRGSITGLGDLTADLTIAKTGKFTKGDIEKMVEGLPSLPGGDYKAELRIIVREEEAANGTSNR